MKKTPPSIRHYPKNIQRPEGKLQLGAYIRVSTQAQKDNGYDRDQENAIKGFLLANLHTYKKKPKWFEDVDVHKAELDPTKRTGLMEALNSDIDKLVAMNISRFGDETNIEQIVELAHSKGVGLITLEEITMWEEDVTRKVGFAREPIDSQVDKKGFIARAKDLRLQDKTRKQKTQKDRKSKLQKKIKAGLGIGGKPFYGYDWNRKNATFTFNKSIKIVQNIYKWYLFKRMSLKEIVEQLEKNNVPTPKGKNKATRRNECTWSEATVRQILKNKAYRGLILPNGLVYPPAIDSFNWERAQVKRTKSVHTLSNIVWCKSCNTKMKLKGDNFNCPDCKNRFNETELLDKVWELVERDRDKKLEAITDLKKIEYAGRIKERIGIKKYSKELIIKNWIPVELDKKVWISNRKVSIQPLTLREFMEIISKKWK